MFNKLFFPFIHLKSIDNLLSNLGESMKNLIILLALLLSACSPSSNNSSPTPTTPEENVYNLDAQGIGFFSGSPLAEPVDNLTNLGDVVQGQKKTLAVTIRNTGSTATSLFTASVDTSNFYITSSTCSNKSLPPGGGSCTLTINFSSTGKALGVFTGKLSFGNSFTNLKATVISSAQAAGGGGGSGGSTSPLIKFPAYAHDCSKSQRSTLLLTIRHMFDLSCLVPSCA